MCIHTERDETEGSPGAFDNRTFLDQFTTLCHGSKTIILMLLIFDMTQAYMYFPHMGNLSFGFKVVHRVQVTS